MRVLLVLGCVCACGTAQAQGKDTINKIKGDPHTELEITKETFKAVLWLMQGGAKGEYAWELVSSVEHGDTPTEMMSGETSMNAGQYADAISDFQKAAKADSRRVWIYQDAMWNLSECFLAIGKMAEAAKTLAELNTTDPENKHLLKAMLQLGRISLAMGKLDDAEKHFTKLIEVANANEKKGLFYEGRVWKARCLLLGGKLDDAKREFQSVGDQARGQFAKVAAIALLGEAECLVAEKNHSGARDKFNAVIAKLEVNSTVDDELDLLARAYNGLGETYYYQATPDFKESLRAFLHVVTLLDEQVNEQPKALWHTAKCFYELRGEGKEWGQRSMDMRNTLRNKYPSSPWAKKW